MARWLMGVTVSLIFVAGQATAADITGQYVETRTCDVFTGACFANADTGLTGKNGVLAWKIEHGSIDNVKLDGLGIVAVLSASETLGIKQTQAAKSVVIIDTRATPDQRNALIKFAKQESGELLGNIIAVRSAAVELTICACKQNSCAVVKAGDVRIETRCLDTNHDRGCGNDVTFYPPLCKGVRAKAAMTVEHAFNGKELNETWDDAERRGAYVGTFTSR